MRLQILPHCRQEFLLVTAYLPAGACNAQLSRQRSCKILDLARAQRQSMIGFSSGIRRRALDRVEPEHLFFELRAATRSELTHVAMEPGKAARQKIAIKRENDSSL